MLDSRRTPVIEIAPGLPAHFANEARHSDYALPLDLLPGESNRLSVGWSSEWRSGEHKVDEFASVERHRAQVGGICAGERGDRPTHECLARLAGVTEHRNAPPANCRSEATQLLVERENRVDHVAGLRAIDRILPRSGD
jgi:hypothetical protein